MYASKPSHEDDDDEKQRKRERTIKTEERGSFAAIAMAMDEEDSIVW